MENVAFQGLIGVSLAMYLWLISAGLTIIFGVLRIVNFAHGSLFMVGAYLAYTFYGHLGLPFGVAIVLSLIGTGLLGLVMERVLARMQAWWRDTPDRSCSRPMDTYFGRHPMHVVLERTVWHPTQHTRQLMLILDTLHIEPDRRLTGADLAGLPLPDKVWDDEKEAA